MFTWKPTDAPMPTLDPLRRRSSRQRLRAGLELELAVSVNVARRASRRV